MLKTNIEKALSLGLFYLESDNNNGVFITNTSSTRGGVTDGQVPLEIFSSIIIADLLKDSCGKDLIKKILFYIKKQIKKDAITFFIEKDFPPPDADVNSLGYSILYENKEIDFKTVNQMFDFILTFKDDDGRVRVWLSNDMKDTIDPVVGINVIYLSYLLGRQKEITKTEEWIFKLLESDEYIKASVYYHSPDVFLYFLSRLRKFTDLKDRIDLILIEKLKKRIGETEYPIDLAIRVILANYVGIENSEEKNKLLSLQEQNGSWPKDSLYREGKIKKLYGIFYENKSIPTAFAIKALFS